jgi:ParB family chromosome partitioning protein
MKKKIRDIIVEKRLRTESGDLDELVDSIRRVGLIHPVVINENNELLSGFRRFEACKELGWTDIEVKVVKTGDNRLKKLEWEYHENIGRADLTADEIQKYIDERTELLKPVKQHFILEIFKKIAISCVRLFRKIFKNSTEGSL